MSDNYAEDTPFLFKSLRSPAFRFIVVNHNYYGFVRQLREDLQTRYPDRPIHNMDAEKADFRTFSDAYGALESGFFLVENFEQIFKPTDQADLQANRTSLIKGINRTRDRLALKPIALIVFMFHSEEERYMYRLMRAMPDMWSFRAFILELRKQYEPTTHKGIGDNIIQQVQISTLGGNTQEEKLKELDRLQKSLVNMTDIASLKTTYQQIAQIQQDVGYYLNAVQTWQKVQDIEEDVFEKNKIYMEQGDLYRTTGELTQALECYQKALKNEKKNSRQHGVILQRMGDINNDLGDLNQSLKYFIKYNEIIKNLFERDNDNNTKNSLAISYDKLGSVYVSLGDLNKALEFFELRYKFSRELYESYPQNVSFIDNLALSYSKLGDVHRMIGNLEKSLIFFELRNEIARQLYKNYPTNLSYKSGLAISNKKLGSVHSDLGNLEKSLTLFKSGANLFEELYESHPQNVPFRKGLAILYQSLGQVYSSLKNLKKALAYFEKHISLTEELHKDYPMNADIKNGLALSYQWLGYFFEKKYADKQKAREYYIGSEKLLVELVDNFPSYTQFQKNLDWVRNSLGA